MTREKLKDSITRCLMVGFFLGGAMVAFAMRELWGGACVILPFVFLSAHSAVWNFYLLRRWDQFIKEEIKEIMNNGGTRSIPPFNYFGALFSEDRDV